MYLPFISGIDEEGNVKIIPNSNGGATIQLKTWNGIDETKIEPGSFEASLYVGLKSEFDNKNK